MPLTVHGVDRMVEVLMDQNLKYEIFDVRFFDDVDAQNVIDAIGRIGFRAEKHPSHSIIRVFRDTQARVDAAAAGEVFEIELHKGEGGFEKT
jgi:hypothetical protein